MKEHELKTKKHKLEKELAEIDKKLANIDKEELILISKEYPDDVMRILPNHFNWNDATSEYLSHNNAPIFYFQFDEHNNTTGISLTLNQAIDIVDFLNKKIKKVAEYS